MAILGFALAAVLLVFSLMARVQFTVASDTAAQLESQINELTEQKSRLTIAYESALNLTEIEDYAINNLGMQKPHSDQVVYVNGTSKDKAVILSGDSGNSDSVSDLTRSLAEYLGR